MRLFHLLWLFILLLNSDSSLQQNAITCKLILPPVEGTSYGSVSRNVFLPGDTLRVICGEKYGISNNQQSAVTTCNEDGEWSIRPVCTEVVCSNERPQRVDSWGVNRWEQSKMGKTTRYTCERGYKRTDGATQATCTRDGWTPNPLCQEIICERKDILEADIISQDKPTYRFNDQVRYRCKDGYKGQFTLTCGGDGWTRGPRCTEITCDRKNFPKADIVRNDKLRYRYSEEVNYRCKDEGQFTLTCGGDGWTGSPRCTEITCDRKNFPEADIVRNDKLRYRYNEEVDYRCKDGNQGQFTLTCGGDGWTGSPRCTELVGCGSPPPLTDGDIKYTIKSNYSHQERVEFMCQRYYTMEGEPNRTCINGEWTGQMRCLKPCIVNEDVYRQHNITLKSSDSTFFTHDEVIEFRCARGIPVGVVAMRQRCNGGVILLPTCQ